MVAMARTCTCNRQLRCGSAFLDVGITVRFVLDQDVSKVVTFDLIIFFDAVKSTLLPIPRKLRTC